MRVLVLGSGGREHALAWKLGQSPSCQSVVLHPGNAGTLQQGIASWGPLSNDDTAVLIPKAKAEKIDLVVIGPEVLLAEGVADRFREAGFTVFGPDQKAALLESSKVFAKEFMARAQVPTADFVVVDNAKALFDLSEKRTNFPVVLKLDGLAAGKGVVVAFERHEMLNFIDRIWKNNEFGPGPHRVVIEEFLPGKEVSYIGLCDGKVFVPMATATDYKRLNDNHEGPNTGGMGVVSPSPFFSDDLKKKIDERIVEPVLKQLQKENLFYRGALYIGLMINESGDPYVLEFNARFGDPETQAILPRLTSDFGELLLATAKGQLREAQPPNWCEDHFVYVVASAEGYPSQPKSGDPIEGWQSVSGAQLFFSGVKSKENILVTSGGRVLGVGALGASKEQARNKAYQNLARISWRGMHYRKDIGGN